MMGALKNKKSAAGRDELTFRLPRMAKSLAALPEVAALYLFGSFARGNPRKGSDLDIAVLANENSNVRRRPRSRAEYVTLASKALGTDNVDVIVLNRAPIVLRHEVLRDGKLLFVRNRGELSRFRIRSSRDYLDTIPLRYIFEKAYFRKIRKKGFGRQAANS